MGTKTIEQAATKLLQRKRPLTYEAIAEAIRKSHPDAKTSAKTVQWYASRMRKAGTEVRVRLQNDRRNWNKRVQGSADDRTVAEDTAQVPVAEAVVVEQRTH